MPAPVHYDVIVVGAGAAGLFCAFTAGQRGRRVALLEHNAKPGMKIAISGGGRCNFTNLRATHENYLSGNPSFCRSALARFTPADFVALVEKHRIPYHEKKLGQQFCNQSSRAIIDMLLAECRDADVHLITNCRVQEVRHATGYVLETSQGPMSCDSLVIATGGLSFAKLGATDFGHRIARQFGLRVTPLRPGLVPLTFSSDDAPHFRDLSGIALPVRASIGRRSFEEAVLVTHRGFSGPAILQISSYWREGDTIDFDLLPGLPDPLSAKTRTSIVSLLSEHWPRRFAEAWSQRHAPDRPINQWSPADRERISRLLHAWPVTFAGTEGYPKAEVTLGGVDTSDLSSKTMEARNVPGLHFIGEVVDVTGWLGGYNFQWAWASANAAGQVV